MARFTWSLFLALMLLVAPALCVSGLVGHESGCGRGGTESQCQHEKSCSHDPCELLAPTSERDARSLLEIEVTWVSLPVVTGGVVHTVANCWRPARAQLPPDRWKLPYAQINRPLLI